MWWKSEAIAISLYFSGYTQRRALCIKQWCITKGKFQRGKILRFFLIHFLYLMYFAWFRLGSLSLSLSLSFFVSFFVLFLLLVSGEENAIEKSWKEIFAPIWAPVIWSAGFHCAPFISEMARIICYLRQNELIRSFDVSLGKIETITWLRLGLRSLPHNEVSHWNNPRTWIRVARMTHFRRNWDPTSVQLHPKLRNTSLNCRMGTEGAPSDSIQLR